MKRGLDLEVDKCDDVPPLALQIGERGGFSFVCISIRTIIQITLLHEQDRLWLDMKPTSYEALRRINTASGAEKLNDSRYALRL